MNTRIACIQLNTQNDLDANIANAAALMTEAAEQGAKMALLPENAFFMAATQKEALNAAYPMEEHPALLAMQKFAKEQQLWVMIGSLKVTLPNTPLPANRLIVLDDRGEIVSFYDKIHLYDVDVTGGERHQESAQCTAGDRLVLLHTPFAKIGLSICYDLRFPTHYRALAQAGAEVIVVPSAFTQTTGQAHWHILQRARAIENSCYVFAPAQTGNHPAKRQTYGHSLIIDPWGKILADAGTKPGIIHAEIDLEYLANIRKQIPAWKQKDEEHLVELVYTRHNSVCFE